MKKSYLNNDKVVVNCVNSISCSIYKVAGKPCCESNEIYMCHLRRKLCETFQCQHKFVDSTRLPSKPAGKMNTLDTLNWNGELHKYMSTNAFCQASIDIYL